MEIRKKILVADDDEEIVKLIRDRLTHEGYETYAAYEGIRILEVANKVQPDLIILDLLMPAGDGQSVIKRLRGRYQTENIPIIVLTGIRDMDLEQTVRDAGANEFLEKPYDPDVLVEKIKKLLYE